MIRAYIEIFLVVFTMLFALICLVAVSSYLLYSFVLMSFPPIANIGFIVRVLIVLALVLTLEFSMSKQAAQLVKEFKNGYERAKRSRK